MKLSVFVVTYNQEQYIREALDSILAQRVNFDYEIILGEDCSTDSTPAICDEYAAKYSTPYTLHNTPQIQLFHHDPNKGLVENWAFVLNHCHGEYIAMLEGDDFWTNPDKLQTQVDYLDAHPEVVLTFTSANTLYEGGGETKTSIYSNICKAATTPSVRYTSIGVSSLAPLCSATVLRCQSPILNKSTSTILLRSCVSYNTVRPVVLTRSGQPIVAMHPISRVWAHLRHHVDGQSSIATSDNVSRKSKISLAKTRVSTSKRLSMTEIPEIHGVIVSVTCGSISNYFSRVLHYQPSNI